MNNEYYGAPTRPNDDFLAHYGVKGMKWGVRKAVSRGSDRRLSRQYAKASKKLAKLEKRAASGKKYAKRAALLGAGAAAAGGLAAAGTQGVATGMRAIGSAGRGAMQGVGNAMDAAGRALSERRGTLGKIGSAVGSAGRSVRRAGSGVSGAMGSAAGAVETWGKGTSVGSALQGAGRKGLSAINNAGGVGRSAVKGANKALINSGHQGLSGQINKLGGVSNSTLARIGAAGVGAGLLAGAGYNTYRAATTKRAAKKAAQFKAEMNKAFAGTKYANGAPRHQGTQKKKSKKA